MTSYLLKKDGKPKGYFIAVTDAKNGVDFYSFTPGAPGAGLGSLSPVSWLSRFGGDATTLLAGTTMQDLGITVYPNTHFPETASASPLRKVRLITPGWQKADASNGYFTLYISLGDETFARVSY
jgi:hypothetical protein